MLIMAVINNLVGLVVKHVTLKSKEHEFQLTLDVQPT